MEVSALLQTSQKDVKCEIVARSQCFDSVHLSSQNLEGTRFFGEEGCSASKAYNSLILYCQQMGTDNASKAVDKMNLVCH